VWREALSAIFVVRFSWVDLRKDEAASCTLLRDKRRLCLGKLRKKKIKVSARLRPSRGARQRHAQQEHERLQNFGVAQAGIAHVLLLGLAKLLHHGFDFASYLLVNQVRRGLLIDEVRVNQRLIAFHQRCERGDHIAVGKGMAIKRALGARRFDEGKAQAEDQVFALL